MNNRKTLKRHLSFLLLALFYLFISIYVYSPIAHKSHCPTCNGAMCHSHQHITDADAEGFHLLFANTLHNHEQCAACHFLQFFKTILAQVHIGFMAFAVLTAIYILIIGFITSNRFKYYFLRAPPTTPSFQASH